MRAAVLVGCALVAVGCARKDGTSSLTVEDAKAAAISFTRSLCARDYPSAYAMMHESLRTRMTVEVMKRDFERMIPSDWKSCEPLEVMETMTTWPDRSPGDVAWVYVAIPGDLYSEAVTVVIADVGGRPRVRTVEWGRP